MSSQAQVIHIDGLRVTLWRLLCQSAKKETFLLNISMCTFTPLVNSQMNKRERDIRERKGRKRKGNGRMRRRHSRERETEGRRSYS